MGDVVLRLDLELVYEPGEGIEVHLKHGGALSREVMQHLTRAGREVSLVLQHIARPESEQSPEKVRTKIEIEGA